PIAAPCGRPTPEVRTPARCDCALHNLVQASTRSCTNVASRLLWPRSRRNRRRRLPGKRRATEWQWWRRFSWRLGVLNVVRVNATFKGVARGVAGLFVASKLGHTATANGG